MVLLSGLRLYTVKVARRACTKHTAHRLRGRERERASGRALNYPKWKQFSFTAITHSSLLQSSSPLSEHFPHYIFYHDTLILIVVQREPRGL